NRKSSLITGAYLVEDERDEDESIAPPRKRARTTATLGVQSFLDLEASVSDDEEGDEEGDEDGVE
ncbi:hypothetical protein H0H92_010470, partial [Tricholoma furcatifolium]